MQTDQAFRSADEIEKICDEIWNHANTIHLYSSLAEEESKSITMKEKQKSRRKSEESQLPSKSEGCNEIQGFRGNCDSLGKLGMCPSLAEPDLGGFPRSNVSRET